MVPVTIHDVFYNCGPALLVLIDGSGRRCLSIYIGYWDLGAIAFCLGWNLNLRPSTLHFTANLLEAAGGALNEVRITDLIDSVFRAVAVVQTGTVIQEIDARPSDAVALAGGLGRPIYVAERLMAEAGQELTDEGLPPDLPKDYGSMRGFFSEDSKETELPSEPRELEEP